METIKRDEISEESIYYWACPECEWTNETIDDPDYEEYVYCEGCKKEFKLID